MVEQPLGPLELLVPGHDVSSFDCGSDPLNVYLQKYALTSQRSDAARTYVATRGARVVAYYSLAYGSVEFASAPERLRKGLARHPIPVMVLARLAVDRSEQGGGLGKTLLKDALLRSVRAAEIAGMRAVVVHAKNDRARAFYESFDFQRFPTDDYHLMLLKKDIQRQLTSSG